MSGARPGGQLMPGAGLCATCVNAEVIGNRRGSRFLFCALSRSDPEFPRYPALPVMQCSGYRGRGPNAVEEEES